MVRMSSMAAQVKQILGRDDGDWSLPVHDSDPTDAPDGYVYYHSGEDALRVIENGSVMNVDTTAPA